MNVNEAGKFNFTLADLPPEISPTLPLMRAAVADNRANIEKVPLKFSTSQFSGIINGTHPSYSFDAGVSKTAWQVKAIHQDLEKEPSNSSKHFKYLKDEYKTQALCETVVKNDAFCLLYVPNDKKTQEMCDGVLSKCSTSFHLLVFLPHVPYALRTEPVKALEELQGEWVQRTLKLNLPRDTPNKEEEAERLWECDAERGAYRPRGEGHYKREDIK